MSRDNNRNIEDTRYRKEIVTQLGVRMIILTILKYSEMIALWKCLWYFHQNNTLCSTPRYQMEEVSISSNFGKSSIKLTSTAKTGNYISGKWMEMFGFYLVEGPKLRYEVTNMSWNALLSIQCNIKLQCILSFNVQYKIYIKSYLLYSLRCIMKFDFFFTLYGVLLNSVIWCTNNTQTGLEFFIYCILPLLSTKLITSSFFFIFLQMYIDTIFLSLVVALMK